MIVFGHADGYLLSFEFVGIYIAAILYSPVRVMGQILERFVMVQSLFECPHTFRKFQGVT
jgi:hypothetical protein